MQKSILVTGGAGYLGSILVANLLEAKHRVTVFDNMTFGEKSLYSYKKDSLLKIIRDNIQNHENHNELFRGIDVIIHLAGISNDPTGDLEPTLTVQINYFATVSLARRAKIEGVKQFIFMSSCSVYGASEKKLLTEESPLKPATLYALTKAECEKSLMLLTDKDFSVVILRLATLFGYSPRMRFDLAINIMVKRASEKNDILLHGDGKQYRPFLHVHDAADTIKKILEANKKIGGVYNVGREDMNYSISALVREIHSYFPDISVQNVRSNIDPRSYRVSFNKIKTELGIIPKVNVKVGVDEIYEAITSGLLTNLENPNYYNIKILKEKSMVIEKFYSPAAIGNWAEYLPSSSNSVGKAKKYDNQKLRDNKKIKIIAVILAYNCGKMLNRAFERIPKHLVDGIIVIDDGSTDDTFIVAKEIGLKVFQNQRNRGYGGAVKLGLEKAFELGADYAVEIHGDGAQFNPISIQYAIPYMLEGFDLILGSRFLNPRQALANGMPLIRFIANHFLSFFDRWILKLPLTEFHTGFRIYSKNLFHTIPLQKNSENYLFSFEIIAQTAYFNLPVAEVPVEADYINEHTSHKLSGAVIYALNTFKILSKYVFAKRNWSNNDLFPELRKG